MKHKILEYIYSHWSWTLIFIAFIAYLLNILAFYPGYMSNDTIGHLGQAMGVYPVTDLTPPAMTLLWRALIALTDHVSSMLFMQLGMLWAALLLLAYFTWRQTNSKKLSVLPLVIGVLPFIITISGVLWKDNQMVFATLLALAITLCLKYITHSVWRWIMFGVVVMLLWYACLVRYNAIIAMIPVVFLAISQSGYLNGLKMKLIATTVFCALIILSAPAINNLMHAEQRHPVSAVMIDDLVSVLSPDQIRESKEMSPDLKRALLRVQDCANSKKLVLNNFWVCANDADRKVVQFTRYDEVIKQWFSVVTTKPLQYALYRTQTFFMFLFTPEGIAYVWHDGITYNTLGQSVAQPRAGAIMHSYSVDFGYRHFRFLYETWFWLGVTISLLIFVKHLKNEDFRQYVRLLSVSSVLYVVGYWPTGATGDYRYIYWPVLACLFTIVIVVVDQQENLRRLRKKAQRLFAK